MLRDTPTGKPIPTTAHNTSSTSVYISWKAPPPDTILGEFLGYRITYRPRDRDPNDTKEIYIRDNTVESHEIQNLQTYTQYKVTVQVFNPEGLGPETTILVMTDEGGECSGPLRGRMQCKFPRSPTLSMMHAAQCPRWGIWAVRHANDGHKSISRSPQLFFTYLGPAKFQILRLIDMPDK
uniref:GG11661 n=1 Tax=Drosophila erecta TaxID=7220 RepID=B3P5H8_DROER